MLRQEGKNETPGRTRPRRSQAPVRGGPKNCAGQLSPTFGAMLLDTIMGDSTSHTAERCARNAEPHGRSDRRGLRRTRLRFGSAT